MTATALKFSISKWSELTKHIKLVTPKHVVIAAAVRNNSGRSSKSAAVELVLVLPE